MRHIHDHIGKTIGHAALSACGATKIEAVIAPDARRADLRHVPDPARDAERERLGLLGRIAAVVCLIELYSGAPDDDDVIACLGKLIAFRQELQREAARRKKRRAKEKPGEPLPPPEPFVSPVCWIIAARSPAAALARLAGTAAPGWPEGVYFGAGALVGAEGALCVGIVDASELPRERSTLLVRFMAAGPLLADAIEDLGELGEGEHEHSVAERILVDLEHVLGSKSNPSPEEKEFVVAMQGTFRDARRIGRAEGLSEGRAEEAARAVLTVLRVRGIAVPDAARERILAEKDPARLEVWLERAILAASVADVFGDESQAA